MREGAVAGGGHWPRKIAEPSALGVANAVAFHASTAMLHAL
ncbi:MAG TPA: hypothetical protein VMH82_02495 [Myxococcota bacterium]|nr:hypothetical protein [Myxococcota bacterium]